MNEATVPEICVCSAILATTGEVITGRRHDDCLKELRRQGLKKKAGPSRFIQGFVTSTGRYVDRLEAFQLQKAAGIPSASEYREGLQELFSEDLY